MPLQTSGAISIGNIATEFGGVAPHSLSEYYRGGANVPDTPANAGIPTSGAISLTDFYGGDATEAFVDAVGGEYVATSPAPNDALSQFRLLSTGQAQASTSNPENFFHVANWLLIGIGSDYDVRWNASGDTGALSGSAINTWLNLGASRNWAVIDTSSVGPALVVTGNLEIRDASTLAVLDTKTLTLSAQQGV